LIAPGVDQFIEVKTMTAKFVIPEEMRALVLDGTGFEHLQVRKVPTPRPGPGQMLARVEAAGICTSLTNWFMDGTCSAGR
jgi:hypothetical protein